MSKVQCLYMSKLRYIVHCKLREITKRILIAGCLRGSVDYVSAFGSGDNLKVLGSSSVSSFLFRGSLLLPLPVLFPPLMLSPSFSLSNKLFKKLIKWEPDFCISLINLVSMLVSRTWFVVCYQIQKEQQNETKELKIRSWRTPKHKGLLTP